MRSIPARLLSLIAAGTFALGLGGLPSHPAAATSLAGDICSVVGTEAPAPAADHAGHCQCCTGAVAGPPARSTDAHVRPLREGRVQWLRSEVVALMVGVAHPRGPPFWSFSPHA